MCTLATEQTSHWLMVDAWEAFKTYQRTAVVLDHFDYEINQLRGGVRAPDGTMRPCRIMLLAGSDLIATMSEPGVWSEADVSIFFLSHVGCCHQDGSPCGCISEYPCFGCFSIHFDVSPTWPSYACVRALDTLSS
jgi:nicotinic acid mononucleotide adenylyltransferase